MFRTPRYGRVASECGGLCPGWPARAHSGRRNRTIPGFVGFLIGMVSTALPVTAQQGPLSTSAIEGERARIVFPVAANLPLADARRVLAVAESVPWTVGLPSSYVPQRSITISLASRPRRGASGWSSVESWLVVLPLSEAVTWPEQTLRRVLRHEMAHVLLADVLGTQSVPTWFVEGFAEWAAGGLTCEGRVRVEIEIRHRIAAGLSLLTPEEAWGALPARLAYDVATSFVEFLDRRDGNHVNAGNLVANIAVHGWQVGFQRTFRVDHRALEAQWLDELAEESRQAGNREHCGPTNPEALTSSLNPTPILIGLPVPPTGSGPRRSPLPEAAETSRRRTGITLGQRGMPI